MSIAAAAMAASSPFAEKVDDDDGISNHQIVVRFQNHIWVWESNESCHRSVSLIGDKQSTHGDNLVSCLRDGDMTLTHQLLQFVADRTGWPLHRLRVQPSQLLLCRHDDHNHHEHAFCSFPLFHVQTTSSLLGGKGGFGTLLKGQSRQAGAKATTNFGACRDLQGRRLHSINDSLHQQFMMDWQQRIRAGTATKEDMARALTTENASGIPGWHLPMIPNWATFSVKKQRTLLRRQFRSWQQEAQAAATQQQAQQQQKERAVHAYVDQAQQMTAQVQAQLQSALAQGLAAATRHKQQQQLQQKPSSKQVNNSISVSEMAQQEKGESTNDHTNEGAFLSADSDHHSSMDKADNHPKRRKTQPEVPTALLTLAGDVILEYSDNVDIDSDNDTHPGTWQMQASRQANFSTIGILLADATTSTPQLAPHQCWYYEIRLRTAGLVQVGWANLSHFEPNSQSGDGVGDCTHSWAYDGSRGIVLHGGQSIPYPQSTLNHHDMIVSDSGTNEEAHNNINSKNNNNNNIQDGFDNNNEPQGLGRWKAGDIVGCCYNPSTGIISFSLNGTNLGDAFVVVPPVSTLSSTSSSSLDEDEEEEKGGETQDVTAPNLDDNDIEPKRSDGDTANSHPTQMPLHLMPAISFNPGEIIELHLYSNEMKYGSSSSERIPIQLATTQHSVVDNANKVDHGATTSTIELHHQPVLLVASSNKDTAATNLPLSEEKSISSIIHHDSQNVDEILPSAEVATIATTSTVDDATDRTTTLSESVINLDNYLTVAELETLGLDRLKKELMARGVKCGGTLQERATRLMIIKGIDDPMNYPVKLLARPSNNNHQKNKSKKKTK